MKTAKEISTKRKRFELLMFYGYTSPTVRFNLSKKSNSEICNEYDFMVGV